MKISVYITSYNKIQYINEAINSVLDQSRSADEIIIVDDGSKDGSREIISGYASRYPGKIKVIFNEKNLGISKTRNIAISNCTGEIITFVDADDYFFPMKIETELELLRKTQYDCIYSNFIFVDEFSNENGCFADKEGHPVEGDLFIENFTRSFHVNSGSNFHNEMFYKSCAQEIGLYDEKIKIWEDWDFRIRMSKKYRYGYCPDVNSAYRKLENGLHNSVLGLHYREQMKVYKKNKHLLSDLEESEKRVIQNSIYAKLKKLIINIGRLNISKKQYLRLIINCFQFIWAFQSKKTVGFFYKELFNNDA